MQTTETLCDICGIRIELRSNLQLFGDQLKEVAIANGATSTDDWPGARPVYPPVEVTFTDIQHTVLDVCDECRRGLVAKLAEVPRGGD